MEVFSFSPFSQEEEERLQRFLRARRLGVILVAVFAILGARLWYLQVLKGEQYARLADGNRIRQIPVTAARGVIRDRNGELLAKNRLSFTISLVPGGVRDAGERQRVLQRLAALLEVPVEELQRELGAGQARNPYEPIRLRRDVPPDKVIAVEEQRMDLPGIVLEEEPVREYPWGAAVAHVVGEIGQINEKELAAFGDRGYRATDLIGKTGIEFSREAELRGQDGAQRVEVNALSRPVQVLGGRAPEAGDNVWLTLDLGVQLAAQQALEEAIRRARTELGFTRAQAGAVVLMKARTGEVLALASYPGYDPNLLLDETTRAPYWAALIASPEDPLENRATRGIYAPGSTFKAITALAALEEGVLRPGERFYADGYSPEYGGVRRMDWYLRMTPRLDPPGWITLREALERSVNDFFWTYGDQLGIHALADWARRFGLGSPTGIDLFPREKSGLVPDPAWKRKEKREPWYPGDTLNVAIGQGDLGVTPLQMALVYAAFANRGSIPQPYVVQRIEDASGRTLFEAEPRAARFVAARPEHWQAVHEGLKAVTQPPRGLARQAFEGFSVPVAGKTGTTQAGSRSQEETHAWFVGYAPADEPEVVVSVVVEFGGGGSSVAAPVARKVLETYFAARPQTWLVTDRRAAGREGVPPLAANQGR